MKNSGGIRIIMIAALALIILAGTGAAASLSNSGGGTWKYQRDISIKENSGTALTDYQVLIELKGADFPVEAKSNGADVRFADSNGNELNYWIESWDYAGKNARIWVKVLSIPAGSSTTIRMYYGNPRAVSTINGDGTFEFFDDFEGTSLDTNKWNPLHTVDAGTSTSVHDGLLDFDVKNGYLHTGGCIISKTTLPSAGYVSETKVKFTNYYQSALGAYVGFTNAISYDDSYYGNPTNAVSAYLYDYYKRGNYLLLSVSDIGGVSGITSITIRNIWFKIKTIYAPPTYAKGIWIQLESPFDERTLEKSGTGGIAPTYVTVGIGDYNTNEHTYFDFVFIRKFTSSEPTITLSPPKSSSLTITKSSSPYSLRQFQESTIKVLIENSGTSEVKAIEIMDSIHPSFDLTGGDFPNPRKFDSIRAGESRELQYTIRSKESGAFTLDPATVTYADSEGNIQEVKSEAVSIKVVPSSDGGSSGTNTGQNSKSASVSLHGEKTDVVIGEDIQLRLSAVNLITKPKMHVQVIIIPPSGMSVTSSEFSKSAAGQFTANYQLEPGDGKDIEVRIRSNQVGDFNVNGRIIYYFGDDKEKAEDHTLNLPIKVRRETGQTAPAGSADVPAKAPGFEAIAGIIALLLIILNERKWI